MPVYAFVRGSTISPPLDGDDAPIDRGTVNGSNPSENLPDTGIPTRPSADLDNAETLVLTVDGVHSELVIPERYIANCLNQRTFESTLAGFVNVVMQERPESSRQDVEDALRAYMTANGLV